MQKKFSHALLEEEVKDDERQRYVFHSMILNLEDIITIYDFFKDFQDEFTASK